jgi:crotonobetainyl-CoA:carnitine CoA-transferase CaiB-like acyl-CoA transferase
MADAPTQRHLPLHPYRVLDLSDERGLLCGQLLADLGADTIVIEPPGGSKVRAMAPFRDDRPDPNGSLYWWAYNRNKRGITLDAGHPEGKALIRQLAAGADFLIESAAPGHMAGLGLGYQDLAAVNPRLIYVSISPFGQSGPKAAYAASDLTVLAAGGPLDLTGDDDRSPLRVAVPQAYLHAAADAALGAMIAHFERVRSGRGQHVDVAAQEAMTIAMQSGALAALFGAEQFRRHRGGLRLGPLENQCIWPARDGYITLAVAFGANAGPFMVRLKKFLHEQSLSPGAPPELAGVSALMEREEWPGEERERIVAAVHSFTSARTKAELMEIGRRHNLMIGTLESVPEVFDSPQLRARGFWRPLEHPEAGRAFLYPGPFVKFGATPLQYNRRPPTLGEHNDEIYIGELGLSPARLRELRESGVI